MSVVWPTAALLLVLSPGIAFLAGIGWPTRFRRGFQLQSQTVQLASVIAVSFFVHSVRAVFLADVAHPTWFPTGSSVDLRYPSGRRQHRVCLMFC